jgi:ATP-dependent DNA helicase DinG
MVSIDSIKEQIQTTYRQLIKSRSLTPRYGQRKMIAQITNELSKCENSGSDAPICVIEAGTGTGKTLAYLLASIPVAKNYGHKVIISTATIDLQ